MSPVVAAAIVTAGGALILGILTLLVTSRLERTKQTVLATNADSEARIDEWDRLLKNCREDNDRVRREADDCRGELNSYRKRKPAKDDDDDK